MVAMVGAGFVCGPEEPPPPQPARKINARTQHEGIVLRTLDPRISSTEAAIFELVNAKFGISCKFLFDPKDGTDDIPSRLLAILLSRFSCGTLPTAGHPSEYFSPVISPVTIPA
jgi:hypothetical protein